MSALTAPRQAGASHRWPPPPRVGSLEVPAGQLTDRTLRTVEVDGGWQGPDEHDEDRPAVNAVQFVGQTRCRNCRPWPIHAPHLPSCARGRRRPLDPSMMEPSTDWFQQCSQQTDPSSRRRCPHCWAKPRSRSSASETAPQRPSRRGAARRTSRRSARMLSRDGVPMLAAISVAADEPRPRNSWGASPARRPRPAHPGARTARGIRRGGKPRGQRPAWR